jgi:hypothetical protein
MHSAAVEHSEEKYYYSERIDFGFGSAEEIGLARKVIADFGID